MLPHVAFGNLSLLVTRVPVSETRVTRIGLASIGAAGRHVADCPFWNLAGWSWVQTSPQSKSKAVCLLPCWEQVASRSEVRLGRSGVLRSTSHQLALDLVVSNAMQVANTDTKVPVRLARAS